MAKARASSFGLGNRGRYGMVMVKHMHLQDKEYIVNCCNKHRYLFIFTPVY